MINAIPPIGACAGRSSAARLANPIAARPDRAHVAQLSRCNGVRATVARRVAIARAGRYAITIDARESVCAFHNHQHHGIAPAGRLDQSAPGIVKLSCAEFLPGEFSRIHAERRRQTSALRAAGD